jgi:hypothetical protein
MVWLLLPEINTIGSSLKYIDLLVDTILFLIKILVDKFDIIYFEQLCI